MNFYSLSPNDDRFLFLILDLDLAAWFDYNFGKTFGQVSNMCELILIACYKVLHMINILFVIPICVIHALLLVSVDVISVVL